jgi:hypothetical protein
VALWLGQQVSYPSFEKTITDGLPEKIRYKACARAAIFARRVLHAAAALAWDELHEEKIKFHFAAWLVRTLL